MGDNLVPTINSAAVEFAGRNWLTAQLLVRGFEVSIPVIDRGVDLIAFKETGPQGIRAHPLQLKCSSGESFSLDRKYAARGIPLAYVWHSLSAPVVFFTTHEEALQVLGVLAVATASGKLHGKYAVTSAGSDLTARMEPFTNRWDWLAKRLEAQPPSGE